MLRSRDELLRPEAEALGYDVLDLSDKYSAVRTFYWHRGQGSNTVWTSEQAGWHVLVSGRTEWRWAADYASEYAYECEEGVAPGSKLKFTFSVVSVGRHRRRPRHHRCRPRHHRRQYRPTPVPTLPTITTSMIAVPDVAVFNAHLTLQCSMIHTTTVYPKHLRIGSQPLWHRKKGSTYVRDGRKKTCRQLPER